MQKDLILIVDYDGRYDQIIARAVRNKGVYCEAFSCDKTAQEIKGRNPNGIIAALPPENAAVFNAGAPVLAVSAELIGKSGLDQARLDDLLGDFLFNKKKCACVGGWNMSDYAETQIAELKKKLAGKKALCAVSGGVDSTVCAVMAYRAMGSGLSCVFVDHGLMRLNEPEEILKTFDDFGISVIKVDARERFLSLLQGVNDPERKRKIIGEQFIRVFEEEAKKIGAVDFLIQGTIYPDIIESGSGKHAVVKSHHNVGGLPDVIDFKEIIEPVRYLFKDEVRACGLALGLPEKIAWRQPFPGPGVGVRVMGEITKEKLEILKKADFIFRGEIAAAGLDRSIWQYFAILADGRSVGARGGARVYGHTIALRAVNSVDAMTAEWVKLPYDVLEKTAAKITAEIPDVNRVVYDITAKPPATIEWE